MRILLGVALLVLISIPLFGQSSTAPPAFDIADVHTSAPTTNPFFQGGGGGAGGRGGDAAPSTSYASTASDPSGALSIFEAISKQLGLKLEKQKRPLPVLVIDHVEEKPTDN